MDLRARMLQLVVGQAEAEDLEAASSSRRSISEREERGRCLLGEAGEAMLEPVLPIPPSTLVAGAEGMGEFGSSLARAWRWGAAATSTPRPQSS
jgi:hypothetical protein